MFIKLGCENKCIRLGRTCFSVFYSNIGYWAVCGLVFLDDENLDEGNLDYQYLDLSSYSHLTKAGPQVTVGKANKNYVNFWYETEQTGPAMLSTKL